MAQKTKKGMHLCASLEQCTFHDHFQIQIAGLHTFLGDPMGQIGDLLFERKTMFDGSSFKLYSLNQ